LEHPSELNFDRAELSIIFYLDPTASESPECYAGTIASLLAQTDPDWQLLLVADAAIVPSCLERIGDRAYHLAIDPTRSIAEIYNTAIQHVQTPWVAFLEAGVTWSAEWIAHHRSVIGSDPSVIARFGAMQVTEAPAQFDSFDRIDSKQEPLSQHALPSPILWSSVQSSSQRSIASDRPLDLAAISPEIRPDIIHRTLAECLVWNPISSIANLVVQVDAWNQVGGLVDNGATPLEFHLWNLAVRLAQQGSVHTSYGLGDAACCTHSYRRDPGITPKSLEHQLDHLFRDLGDPCRRLRPRSRRNLLRWHGFHALQSSQDLRLDSTSHDDYMAWVHALVRYDRSLVDRADQLDALVTRIEQRTGRDNWIDRYAALSDRHPGSTVSHIVQPATALPAAPNFLLDAIQLEPFPLISVIIPIFNSATTITATIASVMTQTCADFEVLAINDGSTDDTLGHLEAIEDDRLWIYSFPNAGAATSRNRGLKRAIGRYCSFLDADDCWTTDKLATQYNALIASQTWASGGAKVAYSWVDYIDAQGDFLRKGSHLSANGDVFAHLLLVNFLETGSNFLTETRLALEVGGSDTMLAHAEEWDYGLRLAWRTQFVCVPQVQVYYRLLPHSKSSQVESTTACCQRVLDRAFAYAPQALHGLRPYSFANLYRYSAYRTLTPPWTRDRCQQALDYLQRAIDTDPLTLPETYHTLVRACLSHLHLPRSVAQRLYPDDQCDFSALFQATKSSPYPLVSVIIPAYNAANTIGETIASVQAQTLRDWEIILIDDGSTDETAVVVEAIGDPRIQVYRYSNAGQGESRNRGACHATGEFFAFLDADDLWLPDKLERMVKAIGEHPQAAVAYSWIDHIDQNGHFLTRASDYTRQGYVYDKLLLSDFIAGGSNLMLWRGAFGMVGGFNPDLPPAEDRDMWLRLAEKFHFVAIEAPLLRYRQVPQSQSANVTRMERSQRRVIEAAFDRAPNNFPFTELPELLPYYKRQVLANTYKYLTFKQLDAPVTQASARIALRLFRMVLDHEPTLVQQHRYFVIKLWLRIWLATVLSPPAIAWVFKRFRTFHRLHRDLLGYTRMSLRDLLPEDLRERYAKLTDG